MICMMTWGQQKNQNMSISVSMIVRNSSDVLERCLKSVKGVEEIVIVDTGSQDNTIEIAKKYTDKVYEYWGCNHKGKKDGLFENFADARNKSLSYCTSTHILTIDADEYLEEGSLPELKKFNGLALSIRCIHEKTGEEHRQPRLYANHPDIYWKGAAHNYLSIAGGTSSDVKIYYGANKQKKNDPDRTMRILRREVRRHRQPRDMYYLAKEYHRRGWFKKAIRMFKRYVRKSEFPAEKADAFIQLARCYAALKNIKHSMNCVMAAINVNPQCKEALRLAGEMSGDVNRLKYKHLAAKATNDGVLFIRQDNRMKITMLSDMDWAGSGFRVVQEVRRASEGKVDIEAVTIRKGQGSNKFYMKTGPSVDEVGWDVVQERINQSDIIHYKGDVPYGHRWHGLKIPKTAKIIYTVSGSRLWDNPLKDPRKFKGDLNTYMTTDLHVDGWKYMPQPYNAFNYQWKRGDKFRIVHIPSDPEKKGTKTIIQAIRLLSRPDVEFYYKTGVSHSESVALKQNAHLYIDQMIAKAIASASYEAMGLGVPVISYSDDPIAISPSEGTPEALAECIEKYLDWDKLEKESVRQFEEVQKRCGNMGQKWLEEYMKLYGV